MVRHLLLLVIALYKQAAVNVKAADNPEYGGRCYSLRSSAVSAPSPPTPIPSSTSRSRPPSRRSSSTRVRSQACSSGYRGSCIRSLYGADGADPRLGYTDYAEAVYEEQIVDVVNPEIISERTEGDSRSPTRFSEGLGLPQEEASGTPRSRIGT
ncbi:hypothetical protein C8R47DRAFT_1107745 [Mycena vitilis]|nr:hypothetical protein C8R47DRAFT_1107745 [Mycena vitilis]